MANPAQQPTTEVRLEITPSAAGANPIVITGAPHDLHSDPKKIHELLDLLNMPKGTEVKVLTTASSVVVR